jgi:GT2 family glycosyltransferase
MAPPPKSSPRASAVSVLAVVVATNAEAWLPDLLKGLRQQNYKALDVLAVDNASTDATLPMLEKALGKKRVIRLDHRVGYGHAIAAAVKVASERALPADALLLLHDDAALQKGSLASMLEVLARDRVGIVGAKIVEWDDPSRLQDVGGSTDRYGRVFPAVERGELDQGQHDAVRDVLYAASAALLVSADVVERVGLFDPRYVALRDDLDLCWRARLAGFRVLIAGHASVRHASALYRQLRDGPTRGRVRYYSDRNMIATLIKNYGLARLSIALPVTIVISFVNAMFFLLSGRRRLAVQVLEALQWNVAHLPSTLRARHRAQSRRTVGDADITPLMTRGIPRLRTSVQQVVERVVGEVEERDEERPDAPRPTLRERLATHRVAVAWGAFALLYLIGAREVLRAGHLAGSDMPPFVGAGDLFREFFSGWRSAGTGGAAPATPGLAVLGLLTYACFGSAWLAQRLLVLGLPIAGAVLASRLARKAGLGVAPRRAVGVTYLLAPLTLSALGAGSLSDLVLFAAAPGLLVPILRSAKLLPPRNRQWRALIGAGVALAVVASVSPWSLVFVAGAGTAIGAGVLAIGRPADAGRSLASALLLAGGACALLLPWAIEFFRPDSPIGLGSRGPVSGLDRIVALQPTSVRPIPTVLGFGYALSAVAGVVAATRARVALARATIVSAAVSVLAAWAVARGVPWIAPRPGQPLVLAAVVAALLIGIGAEGFRPALAGREFGWRQVALLGAGGLLVIQLGAAVIWVAGGNRPGIVPVGSLAPAFLAAERREFGEFRVLWVAGGRERPAVDLTAPSGRTLTTYAARAEGRGLHILERTLAAIASGATETAGRRLATFGIRYVIVRPEADRDLVEALARQGDLSFRQRFRGATIFENEASLPVGASVSAPGWIQASEASLDRLSAAETNAGAGPGFHRIAAGELVGSSPTRGRAVLLAEEFSPRWSARTPEGRARPRLSFGWANAFPVTGRGPVVLRWEGQRAHRLALVGELLGLIVVGVFWSRASTDREAL